LSAPKKVYWQEPASFTRALARSTGYRPNYRQILTIVVCLTGALFLGGMLVPPLFGNRQTLSAPALFGACFGVVVFLCVIVPFCLQFVDAEIWLTDAGITRQRSYGKGVFIEKWEWSNIAKCGFATMELSGKTYRALAVGHGDSVVFIGISKPSREAEIRDFIEDLGVVWKDVN
jgi:hypothetical protein